MARPACTSPLLADIDIFRSILEWIPPQSIDACLLKQTCSLIKWITINQFGWTTPVNPNLPFKHTLKRIADKLPTMTPSVTRTLKTTSLKGGELESFSFLCGDQTEPLLLEDVLTTVPGGHIECFGHLSKHFHGNNLQLLRDQALVIAAEHGLLNMIQYLFALGANLRFNNDQALQQAKLNRHDAVIDFLQAFGGGGGSYLPSGSFGMNNRVEVSYELSSAKSFPSMTDQHARIQVALVNGRIVWAYAFTIQSLSTRPNEYQEVMFDKVIPYNARPREIRSNSIISMSVDKKHVAIGYASAYPTGDILLHLSVVVADPKQPNPYMETATFVSLFQMNWLVD